MVCREDDQPIAIVRSGSKKSGALEPRGVSPDTRNGKL